MKSREKILVSDINYFASIPATKKKDQVANVLDLGMECSSGGSWVDKELALVLERLELVGVS